MSQLLTGTVTFLFTDVEGSTRLAKRLREGYGQVLSDHRTILRDAVREHGGEEVDTQGDSFLFAFRRANDAAAAAIAAQRALAAHAWPPGAELRVRMGIHTAEPSVSDEGYYGVGVHRAARIMAAGHGGQVLVSLAASSVLQDADLPGASLRDLGEHRLKDLDASERIYQLDIGDLRRSFPALRTVKPQRGPRRPAEPKDELLERSEALATLAESLGAVAQASSGRLVLVSGEAGVGKTALLRRFCDEHRRTARILWGACDALFTPRPLGPFLDIAEATGGALESAVEEGARPHQVATALMRELGSRPATVVVLDDVHWADEATLDVLGLVGRRIEEAPALVVASYRDDELDRTHPLRMVLGTLATGRAVRRIQVAPFSPATVAKLAQPHGVDPEELFRKTVGNPFFVTEALAAGEEEIPHTVRDAVLARAARLSAPAESVLEAIAVAPPHVELWLLELLAEEAANGLNECLTSGMLVPEDGGVAFRHELARLAVEESLPPNRRLALHRRALAALAEPPTGAPDVERLAHHAEASGDAEAVLRFAPAAGARAASLGAHREAAAQYARAVRFADSLPPEARAELLERRSHECYLADQPAEAVEAINGAIECYRTLGDRRREGDALRSLASTVWCPGLTKEAMEAALDAVRVLEPLPPGHELAMAYATMAQLSYDADDLEGAVAWGTRAMELAERLDDTVAFVNALTTIGTSELFAGIPEGLEKLERSLEISMERVEDHVGRALFYLVWVGTRHRSYELANRYLERCLAWYRERGSDVVLFYLRAFRARTALDQGRWDSAVESASLVLHKRCISTKPRILAHVVRGLVRARRGDPDAWPPLDEALALAEPTGELARIAPVAAARAEAAWLEGRPDAAAAASEAAFELALKRQTPWPLGELAYWRWRAGVLDDVPRGAAEPYAVQIAGDWSRAAALWAEIGCPYEAALALADGDGEAPRRALQELQRLGAAAAAAIVARRLRERGVRGLPRGPRPSTRENPANLTRRELDVLALVAEGLHNSQIAERLFLAEKTVDHHVSAILRKLGVRTRGQASAEAVRLGIASLDEH